MEDPVFLTTSAETGELIPKEVADSVCCIAYDETDPNSSIELTFACPENEEMETSFEIREGVCYKDERTWMWADLDIDMMYDEGEPLWGDMTVSTADTDGTVCCSANEDISLAVLDAFVDLSETCSKQEKHEDEYFTYDAPTCTRRSDVITCYIHTDGETETEVRREEEHCVDTVLTREDCCEAKALGKAGEGLEDACAEITSTPAETD